MPIIETNSGYGYVYRKGEKKQRKLSPFLKFILTVIVVCSLIAGGIFFSRIIPKFFGIQTNYFFNQTNIYAISCGSFDDYETALVLANTVKNQGGAGYIFFCNKKYNVLLSGYEKKQECLTVIDNLSQNGIDANMLTIQMKEISADFSTTNQEKTQIKTAINLFYDCYKTLYTLSNEYDKELSTKSEILEKVKLLINEVKTQKNAFKTNIDSNSNASLVYLKIYLEKLSDNLETLLNTKENFSAEIKNTYFKALMCYNDFRQEIDK